MKVAVQSAIYGPRTLPEILSLATQAGLQGVELFPSHLSAFAGNPLQLRDLLVAADLELTAVFMPFHLVWGSTAASQKGRVIDLCRIAQAAGCNLMEWGGGLPREQLPPGPAVWPELVETYHRCASLAAGFGLRSVFHPQTDHTLSTPEDVDALGQHGLDFAAIGLCPDSWQIHRAGADPLTVFTRQANRISHYHLADCTPGGLQAATFGTGAIAIPALLAQISATGYDGWIVIDSLATQEDPVIGCNAAATYISHHWAQCTPATR